MKRWITCVWSSYNVILTVSIFMREKDMASMRTPEIQFIGYVVNAILKKDHFEIN